MKPLWSVFVVGAIWSSSAAAQDYFPPPESKGGWRKLEEPDQIRNQCDWWNPANGRDGRFQDPKRISGGAAKFSAPTKSDWALRIFRKDPKR